MEHHLLRSFRNELMVKQKLEPPVEMGLGSKAKILALNELEYWAMRREGF